MSIQLSEQVDNLSKQVQGVDVSDTTDRLDWPTIVGIIACGTCVAAFSSYSQFVTARLAGFPLELAWVLPMATDATAFVATRVWLSPQYRAKIRHYAAFIVLTCMVLSFVSASIHLAITTMPAGLRLATGGLPSLSLAALVHLGALLAADHVNAPARVRTSTRRKQAATQPAAPANEPPAVPATADSSVIEITAAATGKRARMLAYLDAHPDATGAQLDQAFDTNNYGRTVLRVWKKQQQQRFEASGE